jgi:hypothetical protein
MPICIVKKISKAESAVLADGNKKTLLFESKLHAKVFLANRGEYCMIGYQFVEVQLKQEETQDAQPVEVA